MNIQTAISRETGLKENFVAAVLDLLDQGSTVPFIARYRKEKTGAMDEVAIADIRDRAQALQELEKRRQAIVKSLEERDLLTKELGQKMNAASSMTQLEDLYEKYRPKRKTKGAMAREKGLEPLARMLLLSSGSDVDKAISRFITPEVPDRESALSGARDIIAEMINARTFMTTDKVIKIEYRIILPDQRTVRFRFRFSKETMLIDNPLPSPFRNGPGWSFKNVVIARCHQTNRLIVPWLLSCSP